MTPVAATVPDMVLMLEQNDTFPVSDTQLLIC